MALPSNAGFSWAELIFAVGWGRPGLVKTGVTNNFNIKPSDSEKSRLEDFIFACIGKTYQFVYI
jgi:hypothetical protein